MSINHYTNTQNGTRHVLQENHVGDFLILIFAPPSPAESSQFCTDNPNPLRALQNTFDCCVSFASCSADGNVVTFKNSNKIRISDNEVGKQSGHPYGSVSHK